MTFDTPCLLNNEYIHDINGLWETSGWTPSASAAVNFRTPISAKITTRP
jgi:hypothetical protein